MWDFGLKDAIDILLVAILMYYLYRQMKSSGTTVLFQGIVAVLVSWIVVSQIFKMRLLGAILNAIVGAGFIVLVVIFQNEIRQFLIRLGSRRQWHTFLKYFQKEQDDHKAFLQTVDEIVMACNEMSESKTGALIVIQREDDLRPFVNSGDEIDARVNARLIEQIFYKNTPLHDGAMIVERNRIKLAAGVLPVSHNNNIPKELGLRHRSAIGLTEQCDARVVVVSEETGDISVCQRGKIYRHLSATSLQKMLLRK